MTGLREPGALLLVSCYELGHQPLGIAWPQAFLERAGFAPGTLDLSIEPFDEARVRNAKFVGIAVPMHTALRIGVRAAERIRAVNPDCFICFYGLYALLNAEYLKAHGADEVLGGEFEGRLVGLVEALERSSPRVPLSPSLRSGQPFQERGNGAALERLAFPLPDRTGLPELRRYVHLARAEGRTPAGYVEASRGCLHACLHCPITPVYRGRFFAVPREVVLEDARRLIARGAGHITFGDPDFLNGPTHARRLVEALHAEFPHVTYDFTAKVEHILKHRALFRDFGATGCAFVVSAVESLSDRVLAALEKGHRAADVPVALDIVRSSGIALRPSFVAFTPWTTLDDYRELLDFVETEDLVDEVDAVQYTIRLLVPPGSALLERQAIRPYLGALDAAAFTYRWAHPDPRMDELERDVRLLVERATAAGEGAPQIFERVRASAAERGAALHRTVGRSSARLAGRAPRLTEPWFCCAEPTETQLGVV
jgi:radical SAM superfamily enzyme YgiQ (UPF0313 family)